MKADPLWSNLSPKVPSLNPTCTTPSLHHISQWKAGMLRVQTIIYAADKKSRFLIIEKGDCQIGKGKEKKKNTDFRIEIKGWDACWL